MQDYKSLPFIIIMPDFFRQFLRNLLVVAQLSFVSPVVPRSLPSNSSTHLARRQSAPRPEDSRFLTEQSKTYAELKPLTDSAIVQAKKVELKPSSTNIKALHKTHIKLLQYQKNGMELSAPVLRVVENVLSRHRRTKHG
jgi:hypothetical protein